MSTKLDRSIYFATIDSSILKTLPTFTMMFQLLLDTSNPQPQGNNILRQQNNWHKNSPPNGGLDFQAASGQTFLASSSVLSFIPINPQI
jgi:hypothetical protein